MSAQLSVIIPVYKVERTLDECVRSVLACCGEQAQVILVDDGSPDACPRLCDEWAARDTRIEVVHRHNGGLSAARNSGLEVAQGDWVTFVDSDDIVCDVPYERLIGMGADIVEFPVRRHYLTDEEVLLSWGNHVFNTAAEYWTATCGWLHCYAWNKLYRRSLFGGVRFPEGRVFEDVWTIPLLLRKARLIMTVEQGCYGYRDNPDGITMTAGGPQLTDLLEGNINAAGLLGILDRRHYAAMVNTQIDVYRATRRIILTPSIKRQITSTIASTQSDAPACRMKLLDRIKISLPIKPLCVIHRWLTHRS